MLCKGFTIPNFNPKKDNVTFYMYMYKILYKKYSNGQGSLPAALTARIGQSGRLLRSEPDSCEVISKSDQRFLRRRFFKNFFMSV